MDTPHLSRLTKALAFVALLTTSVAPALAQSLAGPPAALDAPAPADRPAIFRADADPGVVAAAQRGESPARLASQAERQGQEFLVSGLVIGADDRLPLPGVNVVVVGTTQGTSTDLDGRYEIRTTSELDTLRFSYVGYTTRDVPVLARAEVDVTLRPRNYEGDEIVVIGYGTSEVRDLTGSVAAISVDEIEGRPLISFEEALAGRVAGVQVQQNGGEPFGNFSINVRGVSSYNGSNRPLYIVDGIPLEPADERFLATINTEDIESISVLKDASSASIYGSRASDGVVIITTKTGRGSEPEVRFSTEVGTVSAIDRYDMLNSDQMYEFLLDSRANGNPNAGEDFLNPELLQDQAFRSQNDTDWQDEILQTGITQRYNIAAQGGSGPIRFLASGNYENIEGTLIETAIQRASVRLNMVGNISDRAELDVRLSGARQWGNVTTNDVIFGANFRNALYKLPWETVYDAEGDFADYPRVDSVRNVFSEAFPMNPVADIIELRRERQWQQFLGSVGLTYQLPFNLSYRGTGSTNVSLNTADDFDPVRNRARQVRTEVRVRTNDRTGFNYYTDHALTYDNEWGDHELNVVNGVAYQQSYQEFTFVNASGSINNAQDQLNQQPDINAASGGRTSDRILASNFGRAEYIFGDRYFVTGTYRVDGSSKFLEPWGFFPAVALAWRPSQESFMRDVRFIDDLKLRASYGQLGDNNIGDDRFRNLIGTGVVAFGDDNEPQATVTNLGQKSLQWEVITQLDLGMDVSLYKGRLSFTADYYNRRTEKILGNVTAPPALAVGQVSLNFGTVRNRGVEFAVNTVPVDLSSGLRWEVGANISFNENEVLELSEEATGELGGIPGRGINGGPIRGIGSVNLTTEGEPVGSFWVWEFEGLCTDAQYDEAANTCNGITNINGESVNLQPGDTVYRDVNGDGIIDDADRSIQGSGLPKIFGGITTNLNYGPFGMDALFTYSLGRKIFDSGLLFGISGDSNINKRAEVLDRWTVDNQDTDIPRAVQGRQGYLNVLPSTFFIRDADYFRLRSLSLSYEMPQRLSARMGVRSAQLSLIGTNLFTFSNYSGLDPEASSGRRNDSGDVDASAAADSQGLDLTTYPISRTFGVRLNVTL